jgi:hypothetical protein
MSILNDPNHPILERPWKFEMFTLQYWRPTAESEPFIDVTLKDGIGFRNLRFSNPKDIEIHKGFPSQTAFCIFDVSNRGIVGFNVRVDNLISEDGAVRFWQREVMETGQFSL